MGYFLEVPERVYVEVKKRAESRGIGARVRDCTLPGESSKHYHVEFDDIDEAEAKRIASEVDVIMGLKKE